MDELKVRGYQVLSGAHPIVKHLFFFSKNLENCRYFVPFKEASWTLLNNNLIGKIIEKAVFIQLNNLLNVNGLLDKVKFGFQSRPDSTDEDAHSNTGSVKTLVLVLLILSAAFDASVQKYF